MPIKHFQYQIQLCRRSCHSLINLEVPLRVAMVSTEQISGLFILKIFWKTVEISTTAIKICIRCEMCNNCLLYHHIYAITGVTCDHPHCQTTWLPQSLVPPSKSAFCHEQGQKVDNSAAVIRKIAELCESSEMSDLQIIVAGKRYYTHKLLLCCSSDVFRVMLTNPSWPDAQKGEITLVEEDECVKVFHDFIRYLYSGFVHLTHYNVLPILMLADKYNVVHLRSVCMEYMSNHIVSTTSHNHAVSWLQYAYLCGHRGLAETCREFILCNFHKVMSTVDYLLMQKDVLLDFLMDSNLVIPDEFTLFQGVVHWLQNHKSKCLSTGQGESRKEHILEILSSIRFPMMSLPHLCQLEKEALTNDFHSFFMEQISKAMRYHSSVITDREQEKKTLRRRTPL